MTQATAAGPVDTSISPHTVLQTLPFAAVRIADGFWARRRQTNRQVSLRHGYAMLERAGNLPNLRLAAGRAGGAYVGRNFSDETVYKWLEALAWELGNAPDAGLQGMADAVIDLIAAAQQPDGYLNSYYTVVEPDHRWTDLDHGQDATIVWDKPGRTVFYGSTPEGYSLYLNGQRVFTVSDLIHLTWNSSTGAVTILGTPATVNFNTSASLPNAIQVSYSGNSRMVDIAQQAGVDISSATGSLPNLALGKAVSASFTSTSALGTNVNNAVDGFTVSGLPVQVGNWIGRNPIWGTEGSPNTQDWFEVNLGSATTSALPTGAWTHVAVTKSGNTGTLYVNGVQVGQNMTLTLSPSSLGNTTNNWIGRSQYGADPFLDGQVDEFRIYNRGLSAAEVQALFTAGN